VRASGRARARGMAPREQSCNDAQVFAAAGKSRADCPDRQVQRGRNLFIAHSFQSDEQDYRPLLLGQFGERTPYIAKLQTRDLMRWEHQARAGRQQFDAGPFPHLPANAADVLIVQDRE
jgi:hypothetical protein